MQVNPQVAPLHVAVAFEGVAHAVHIAPHDITLVFDAHAPPQLWKPASQVNAHAPAPQRTCPLGTFAHAWPHVPQFCASVITSAHVPVQFIRPAAQPLVQLAVPPVVEHTGVAPLQAALHALQLVLVPRAVSQPFAGLLSQSA